MSDFNDLQVDPQPFIPVEPVEPQKPKSNRTLWITLIVILVLLILCCCCVAGGLVYGIIKYGFDWTWLEGMRSNLIY